MLADYVDYIFTWILNNLTLAFKTKNLLIFMKKLPVRNTKLSILEIQIQMSKF